MVGVIMGVGLLGRGALVWAPPSPSQASSRSLTETEKWAITSLCSLLATFAFAATAYCRRCWCVVAEESGLRWQRGGKWKSVNWNEITDYWLDLSETGRSRLGLFCFVETATQKIKFPQKEWTNGTALQALIQQRATSASSKEWEQIGARGHEKFPFVFIYNTRDNRSMRFLPFLVLICILAINALTLSDKLEKNPNVFHSSDLPWTLTMLGMLNLLLLCYGMIAWMIHNQYRQSKKRFSQRITATEEGLTYEDGRDRVSLAWEKILVCWKEPKKLPYRYTIQGVNMEFDFLSSIDRSATLLRLLEKRAPEAMKRGRDSSPHEEDLLSQQWHMTPGVHVYHYRTRMARAFLLFPTLMAPLMLSVYPLLSTLYENNPGQGLPVLWIGGVLSFMTPYLWWRYFAGKVVTTSEGVTQSSPFGKRFIAWGDILELKQTSPKEASLPTLTLIGRHRRLRLFLTCNRPDDLIEEVNARSPLLKKEESVEH